MLKTIIVKGLIGLLKLLDISLLKISTNVKITCKYKDGKPDTVDVLHNDIHNVGLNLLTHAALRKTGYPGGIGFVALGSNNAGINVTDTTLGTEEFRKQLTSQTNGATGIITTSVYIAPDEATAGDFNIEEIAWFAGDATGAADSGIMYSRVLYSHAKTSLESIQIERTDTITEV